MTTDELRKLLAEEERADDVLSASDPRTPDHENCMRAAFHAGRRFDEKIRERLPALLDEHDRLTAENAELRGKVAELESRLVPGWSMARARTTCSPGDSGDGQIVLLQHVPADETEV